MSNQAKERFLISSGNWREDGGNTPSQGQLDLNHVIRKELVYQGLAEWRIINGKPCCSLIDIIGGGGGVVTPTTFTSTSSSTGIVLVVDGITQTLNATTTTNAGLMTPTTLLAINNVISLTGSTSGSVNLGNFTGTTISDGATVKTALQTLETSLETKQKQLTVKSSGTTVGTFGQFDKFNFTGATVTANASDSSQVDITINSSSTTSTLEYSAGNGTIVTATGLGVTFARTTPSVWTFTIPTGVKLLSHDIYSTTGENPGANVTINYNYTGNTLTNQGFSTARPPSYDVFNMQPTSGTQAVTGGTATTAFRPSISSVSGGNISMLCQTGSAIGALETLIKGIF